MEPLLQSVQQQGNHKGEMWGQKTVSGSGGALGNKVCYFLAEQLNTPRLGQRLLLLLDATVEEPQMLQSI